VYPTEGHRPAPGQGGVKPSVSKLCLAHGGLQGAETIVEERGELLLEPVGGGAGFAPCVGGQPPYPSQQQGQLALGAEVQ
jgi:hypothetical protein